MKNNRKNKLISMVTVIAMAFSIGASAADIQVGQLENSITITAELGSQCAGNNVTLKVFNPDKSDSDITDNSNETLINTLAFYYQDTADASGKVQFVMELAEDKMGIYNFELFSKGIGTKETSSFVFVGAEKIKEYLRELKELDPKKAESLEKIKEIFVEDESGLSNYKILKLDSTNGYKIYCNGSYCTDQSKEVIYKKLLEKISTVTDTADLAKLFNETVYYTCLDNIVSEDSLKSYISEYDKELGLTELEAYNNIYKSNTLSNNVKTSILKDIISKSLDADTKEGVLLLVEDSIVYGALSAVDIYTQLASIIEDAEEYLVKKGVDMTTYNNSVTDKITFLRKLYNSGYKNIDQFVENMNKLIKESKPSESDSENTGSNGSAGNFGGSTSSDNKSSSSVSISSPAISAQTIEPIIKAEEKTFSDISDVLWAESAILYFSEKGIVNGKAEKTFAPNDNITRAELAKIISLVFGIYDENTEFEELFSDVKDNDWHAKYILSIKNAGIMNGYGNSFGANDSITRQDLVTTIYRAMIQNGYTKAASTEKEAFSDMDKISDYAVEAVEAFLKDELINGIGENEFAPTQTATRAQAVTILYRVLEKLGKI